MGSRVAWMPVTSMWMRDDHWPTSEGGPVALMRLPARFDAARTFATKLFFSLPVRVHDCRRPSARARACSAAWRAPSARLSARRMLFSRAGVYLAQVTAAVRRVIADVRSCPSGRERPTARGGAPRRGRRRSAICPQSTLTRAHVLAISTEVETLPADRLVRRLAACGALTIRSPRVRIAQPGVDPTGLVMSVVISAAERARL